MLHHVTPYEKCLESTIDYLTTLTNTLNTHTSLLFHFVRETLHIKSSAQAISYLNKHPDEELKKFLQTIYNFTQDDIDSFGDHSKEIIASESETRQQLIDMTPASFEIAVDCFVGQIPQSPMVDLMSSLAADRKLSDIKMRILEERMPVNLAVSLAKCNNDLYGGIPEESVLTLLNWTQRSTAQIIFNSDESGRDISLFNTSICGKNDFAIVVVNGSSEIFGSFHGKCLSAPPKNRWEGVVGDDKFFVFTMKNTFNTQMLRFYPTSSQGESLVLFPSRSVSNLFNIHNCYQIGQFESCVSKKKDFTRNFRNVPVASTDIFSGIHTDKFIANKIVVFQLK